jgi:hypothetical protein
MSNEGQASIKPYGPALADAAARGDHAEMVRTAEAARRALAGEQPKPGGPGPHYHPVPPHEADEVRKALAELEKKIANVPKPPHES